MFQFEAAQHDVLQNMCVVCFKLCTQCFGQSTLSRDDGNGNVRMFTTNTFAKDAVARQALADEFGRQKHITKNVEQILFGVTK